MSICCIILLLSLLQPQEPTDEDKFYCQPHPDNPTADATLCSGIANTKTAV